MRMDSQWLQEAFDAVHGGGREQGRRQRRGIPEWDCGAISAHEADVFNGREALRSHLLRVADALPGSFQFVVDDFSSGPDDAASIGVKWHVESNGSPLPFTRG